MDKEGDPCVRSARSSRFSRDDRKGLAVSADVRPYRCSRICTEARTAQHGLCSGDTHLRSGPARTLRTSAIRPVQSGISRYSGDARPPYPRLPGGRESSREPGCSDRLPDERSRSGHRTGQRSDPGRLLDRRSICVRPSEPARSNGKASQRDSPVGYIPTRTRWRCHRAGVGNRPTPAQQS
jgi:hypothetical protein